MKLIDAIRIARSRGHRYVSFDEDSKCYSSSDEPSYDNNLVVKKWQLIDFKFVGNIYLSCDWTLAVIDICKLRGIT